VSQPIHADPNASPEPDPLLAFFSEQSEASGSLNGDGTASPEKRAEFAQPVESVQSVDSVQAVEPRDQATEDLRHRVDRAERLVDRSLIEIATLKSDLATLVGAVEDIKKRQSRRDAPPPPPAQTVKRVSPWRAALAAVVLLTFATLAWGLAAMVSEERPEPPPIESESKPVAVPDPVVEAAPRPVDIQNAATASATPPAQIARPRDVAARGDPSRRPASRATTGYVGTLTVDASPAGEVFVNRLSAGRTPLRLEKLRAGSHLIWIEREGYRRWTRVVAVAANRISRVSATLDPISR
jgi:hypothetical protein